MVLGVLILKNFRVATLHDQACTQTFEKGVKTLRNFQRVV